MLCVHFGLWLRCRVFDEVSQSSTHQVKREQMIGKDGMDPLSIDRIVVNIFRSKHTWKTAYFTRAGPC